MSGGEGMPCLRARSVPARKHEITGPVIKTAPDHCLVLLPGALFARFDYRAHALYVTEANFFLQGSMCSSHFHVILRFNGRLSLVV